MQKELHMSEVIPICHNGTKSQRAVRFPVDYLGPVMGPAAKEIAYLVQLPVEIAAQTVLAVGALVAQQYADISIDGRTSPTSLFLLSVAGSGERKSHADKLAQAPIGRYLTTVREEYREQCKYLSDDEPLPRYPMLLAEEPTIEGIHRSMHDNWPTMGLFSDEGGQFFGGHAMKSENQMRAITALSKFWDGSTITRTRGAKGESYELVDRRMSLHLMMQPIVGRGVFTSEVLKQQGILARCLVAMPESIQGTRMHRATSIEDSEILNQYSNHLYDLLTQNRFNMHPDDGSLVLETIKIHQGTSAYTDWVDFYNDVEAGLVGKYQSIVPAASKMPEQVTRIAGVMAILDGRREITSDDMVNAIYLGNYYLESLMSLEKAMGGDKELNDIEQMVVWFRDYCRVHATREINSRDAIRDSPYKVHKRDQKALRRIMDELCDHGLLRVTKYTGQLNPRATHWEILPDMFTVELASDNDEGW
jgi:Protein of unknown function (DUF3987)